MKRLITLFAVSFLILTSCDSPIGNLGSNNSNPVSPGSMQSQIRPGMSDVQADSVRKKLWRQFKEKNGSKWMIRWSKTTGLPVSIVGGLTKKAYRGSAREAARIFLTEHKDLFGVDVNQLEYIGTEKNKGMSHVTFRQNVKGIPVYEAAYKVHIRPNGQIDMVNGYYYPNISISTSPAISKSSAAQTARSDLELADASSVQVTSSHLVIYPENGKFHLAWKQVLYSEKDRINRLYFVDAHSGEILYELNQLIDITGDGDVYPTHPDLSSVTNRPLYRLNGSGYLRGTYAYIVNDADPEAYSATNSFQYSPGNTHFNEVNLYYHIDDFRHNYIAFIEDGSIGFEQIRAHAHTPIEDVNNDGLGDPNAWFNTNNQELYFNGAYAPRGTNDFAKEDKIIYHEYGHAVIYDVTHVVFFPDLAVPVILSSDDEEGAISEGTPDYWAGAHTDRATIGDYVVGNAVRDMDSPVITSYSEYQNIENIEGEVEAHTGGEFFSSILWDLRDKIGESVLDPLTFDAVAYRISWDPDFLEFRDGLIAADNAFYGGNHYDTIRNTFADWGVGSYVPPSVFINGPGGMVEGNTATFTAVVSGGSPPYNYEWYYKDDQADSWNALQFETSSTYDHTALNASFDYIKVYVSDSNGSVDDFDRKINVLGPCCQNP